jgi:hypothetical protein
MIGDRVFILNKQTKFFVSGDLMNNVLTAYDPIRPYDRHGYRERTD